MSLGALFFFKNSRSRGKIFLPNRKAHRFLMLSPSQPCGPGGTGVSIVQSSDYLTLHALYMKKIRISDLISLLQLLTGIAQLIVALK